MWVGTRYNRGMSLKTACIIGLSAIAMLITAVVVGGDGMLCKQDVSRGETLGAVFRLYGC